MKKKVPKPKKSKKPEKISESKLETDDKFDFGGLPKRDLKKNLGCG